MACILGPATLSVAELAAVITAHLAGITIFTGVFLDVFGFLLGNVYFPFYSGR